ncbi:MAG: MFS transporter [Candidatus Thorarchaeota archaeon]
MDSKYSTEISILGYSEEKNTMERDLVLILVAGLAYSTMLGLLNPTVPLSASALGASTTLLGILLSSRAIVQTGLRVPLGQGADRYGWRRIFLVAFILGVASGGTFFFGIVKADVFLFFPALMLWGMTNAAFRTTEQGYVSGIGGSGVNRTQLIGRYLAITGVGQLAGPPLAGYLIEVWDFGVVYLMFTLLALIGLLSMFFLSERDLIADENSEEPEKVNDDLELFKSYSRALQLIRSNRILAIATFCGFLMTLSFGVGLSFHPVFLRDLGLASFEIGLLLAARDISSIISRLFAGNISLRLGNLVTVFLGIFCVGIGVAITPSLKDPLLAIIPLCATGFGFGIFWPAIVSLIAAKTDHDKRGLAIGVLGTGFTTGFSVGSIIFGIVADIFSNLDYAFLYSGICTLIGFTLVVVYFYFKKDLYTQIDLYSQ